MPPAFRVLCAQNFSFYIFSDTSGPVEIGSDTDAETLELRQR
jgi:hypothetical protein